MIKADDVGEGCPCSGCKYARANTWKMNLDERIQWHKAEILRMKILDSVGNLKEEGLDDTTIWTLEVRLQGLTALKESGSIQPPEQ